MQTFRELVYMVLDELKLYSDDANFTEDHIIFLLTKYRAFILKQRYSDVKKIIPDSNYQDLCIEVSVTDNIPGIKPDNSICLKSNEKVPLLLPFGLVRLYTDEYYAGEITYVTKDRMRYTGYNKYLSKIIYCSTSSNEHLYFKSSNEEISNIENIHFYGIFQDCALASEYECDKESDLLDRRFPIEDSLVSPVIELVVKELLGAEYRPEDSNNNASDDLSNLASFLQRNTKSQLAKSLE